MAFRFRQAAFKMKRGLYFFSLDYDAMEKE